MDIITNEVVKLCRACENTNELMELHEIIVKWFHVTGLNVDVATDELPRWICRSCVNCLESSHSFKTLCENTDRKLRDEICLARQKQLEKNNQEITVKLDYDAEQTAGFDETQLKQEKVELNDENIQYLDETDEPIKNEAIEFLEIVQEEENDEKEHSEVEDTLTLKETSKRKTSKAYKCETCSSVFHDFIKFNSHKKTHGKKRFQCDVCERWFPMLFHLKAHQETHSDTKNYDCHLCKKTYKHRGNLDRHVNVFHKNKRTHVCDICGKGFSQSTILKQHYTVHLEERNFECETCQKKFKSLISLNLHKQIHLPKAEQKTRKYRENVIPFVCTFCGKISTSLILHTSHLRTHTGEKPFECPTCQKKFTFVQSLQKHLLLHTGAKPYKCETCGLDFRQLNHLKGHRLIHSGEKNYKCLVCEKTFALPSNLKVHMRIHTGEKPFSCTECPMKFYASNGLKKHKLVHLK